MQAGTQLTLDGSAVTNVSGGVVQLNGCSRRLAGIGDQTLGTVSGSAVTGGILTGSSTVCAGHLKTRADERAILVGDYARELQEILKPVLAKWEAEAEASDT